MSFGVCPSCGRHFVPPGPCRNISDGEVCGYVEPEDHEAVRRAISPGFDPLAPIPPTESTAAARAEAREALSRVFAAKGDPSTPTVVAKARAHELLAGMVERLDAQPPSVAAAAGFPSGDPLLAEARRLVEEVSGG